jgi:hypothetical protein
VRGGESRLHMTKTENPKRWRSHPIKKLIKKFFKIEEIDYDKFREESMWAIRLNEKKDKE